MKKFMQDLLVNFALVVLGSHLFFYDNVPRLVFILQLLAATVVIRLLLLLTNKFNSHYPILEYLLELGMVLIVVLGFGWLFQWYDLTELWIMIASISAVYIAVYLVGIGEIKRDAAFINKQIKRRKEDIKHE